MASDRLILIALGLILVAGICVFLFARSVLGKSVRGVLHVPQGRTRVDVKTDPNVRPTMFTYAQTFEANYARDERGQGVLVYSGKTIGSVSASEPRVRALNKLTDKHKHVAVSVAVASFDAAGLPILQLALPDDGWFRRALKPRTR
jgi:hypothetical protein